MIAEYIWRTQNAWYVVRDSGGEDKWKK